MQTAFLAFPDFISIIFLLFGTPLEHPPILGDFHWIALEHFGTPGGFPAFLWKNPAGLSQPGHQNKRPDGPFVPYRRTANSSRPSSCNPCSIRSFFFHLFIQFWMSPLARTVISKVLPLGNWMWSTGVSASIR